MCIRHLLFIADDVVVQREQTTPRFCLKSKQKD